MKPSAASIASDLRLRRQAHIGAFLILEGGIDSRFIRRFIDQQSCMPVVAQGREKAIDILRLLNEADFPGVLAIVDADFDPLIGIFPVMSNLLTYDYRDSEIMIIESPSLMKLLDELGSPNKIANFEMQTGIDVRSAILERAHDVGILRMLSQMEGFGLRFEGLNFRQFLEGNTLSINVEAMITNVRNHSRFSSQSVAMLVEKHTQLKGKGYDRRDASSGHDSVEILSVGLRRILGDAGHTQCVPLELERSLRLGYEETYFRNTRLYNAIRGWEDQNPPYRVLL